jgi:ADP-heptose:LPS heptosyltransferase
MRSVVFANHGVGDVIMALPLIRALTSCLNDYALVVTKTRYEGLVVSLGSLGPGKVKCLAIMQEKCGRLPYVLRRLRRHKPDLSVLTYGINPLKGSIISILSGARMRVGPDHPIFGRLFTHRLPYYTSTSPPFHKVDYVCQIAALIGRKKNASSLRITFTEYECRKYAQDLLSDEKAQYIGIAFGSGVQESHKRLSVDYARQLIDGLKQRIPTAIPVLLGGESELSLNAAIARKNFSGINLTGRTSPKELLSILGLCSVLYASCNGVSHFAAAAGCPVIGFFGPTNPALTGPYGVPLTVVRRGLNCSPCYRRGYIRGCGNPICMAFEKYYLEIAIEEGVNYLQKQ